MFPSRRIVTSGGDVFRNEYSLAFDGTNDYISLASATAISGDWTVSSWVKPTNVSYKAIVGSTIDTNTVIAFKNADELRVRLEDGGSYRYVDWDCGFGNWSTTEWFHLVVTKVGTTLTPYLNGSVGTAGTLSGSDGVLKVQMIGGLDADGDGLDYEYEGNIDEVAIWNKALSASEVATIYNGREPYNHKEGVASANLQSWWRMGDGILDDMSVNAGTSYSNITYGIIADQVNPTLGAELAVDGSFEAGLTPVDNQDDEWTEDSVRVDMNLEMTHAADNPHSGDNSAKITIKDGTSGSIAYRRDDYDTNQLYKAEIYIKKGSGQTISNFEVFGDTSFTGTGKRGQKIVPTESYQKAVIYFRPTNAIFFVSFKATGTEDHFGYVDDFSIKEVNGSSGKLRNFDGGDFTGDTP